VKKKLAALNLKVQLGLVALGLIVFAFAGHMFVVSPQGAQAAKVQTQIDAEQTLIFQRKASLRVGLHPPAIQVADLFRLARAMPDREDMPGIILTLSQVARDSGITFDLIEPVAAGAAPLVAGNYQTQRIHLLFNGDFYGLSDFLYRLRSLVAVHHGTLLADGRLFNVDTVTFQVQGNKFPQISAELFVDAYVYGGAAAAPATTTPGATTPSTTTPATTTPATTTPSADSSLPAGATAAGATP
jgi:Tfp pilus assembly protein PilO